MSRVCHLKRNCIIAIDRYGQFTDGVISQSVFRELWAVNCDFSLDENSYPTDLDLGS